MNPIIDTINNDLPDSPLSLTLKASDETLHTAFTAAPIQEIFSSVQGEGPFVGFRQIFVRFAHCHLKCAYCDTPMQSEDGQCHIEWESGHSKREAIPNPVSVAQCVSTLARLLSSYPHHSVSFTGGEPLLYHRFLQQVFPEIQKLGGKTYLETSGTQPEFLEAVLPYTNYIAMDIKLPSTTKESMKLQEHQQFYQRAKTLLKHSSDALFIKLVVNDESSIPGEELEAIRAIVTDADTPIILQPETSLTASELTLKVTQSRLFEMLNALQAEFQNVRVIPQTHKMIQVS